MDHSILAPSSAHIWGAPKGCRGWVAMAREYPEADETPEADEGEQAHELAAYFLHSRVNGAPAPTLPDNAEMVESATLYAGYIHGIVAGSMPLENFGVEDRLSIEEVHPECFGTVDAWAVVGLTLHIFDFKYGYLTVEAFKNIQCLLYSAGLLKYYPHVAEVKIHIIQPRAPHKDGRIRTWSISRAEASRYFRDLKQYATEALSELATTTPGAHCKYCQARHGCQSMADAALDGAQYSRAIGRYDLDALGLSRELKLLTQAKAHIEYRLAAIETQVESLLRSGQTVPGFILEKTGGHGSRWTVPDAEVIKLGELVGKELKKISVLTPNQAKDKGVNKKVIESISERKQGRVKLTPINEDKIKSIFGVK